MDKSILEVFVGSLDEKRAYKDMMKRVNALPKEYSYAFKKIQKYMYNVELDSNWMRVFTDLLTLFEECAMDKKALFDVIGNDVASFCDEFIQASEHNGNSTREKLNSEIYEYFHKEGSSC